MNSAVLEIEEWELIEPFEISRCVIETLPVLLITVKDDAERVGRAEAHGVDYEGETPLLVSQQIQAVLPQLFESVHGQLLTQDAFDLVQTLLPPGGARNALDCALWDLRAKQINTPAWKTAGLDSFVPLTTVYTIGLGNEADTRRKARDARHYPLLKLKCDAERHVDVVRWVREEHPKARIAVDANQSWSRELLDRIMPKLVLLGVEMVEQPVKAHYDDELLGYHSPLPLAADESCTDRTSLAALTPYYQYINIKLDKCGGLTEALAMSDEARALGLKLMVGNMCGTSLGMAPAFLIGQRCGYVDLDGPLLQKKDRQHALECVNGVMQPPVSALWG